MFDWLLEPVVVPWAALVFGALLGSFLNVVILRLPRRMEHAWKSEAREILGLDPLVETPPPGLVVEGSHCPACRHRLRWWENVPVLSWLALRGKCRACGTAISCQYPLVESLTALLFLACVLRFGPSAPAGFAMVYTAFLIAGAGIDFRTQLLPDVLTYPLLWIGLLLAAFSAPFVTAEQAILGAAAGYLSLWSVATAFRLLTGKDGMGHGDFKLLAALGAWLGWQPLLLVVILASVSGAVLVGGLMAIRGRDSQVPFAFGPFLAIGGWIALIYGEGLIGAYLGLFAH